MIFYVVAFGFPSLLMLAGGADVLSRCIPNRLTFSIAVSFFPAAILSGMPISTMILSVVAAFLVLAGGFILFSVRFIGGGDAKLLAAAALWFGFQGLPMFLTMTVLAGGALSLAVMAWSLLSLHHEIKGSAIYRLLKEVRPSVPYGYAIAAGAIMAFPESWWGRLA